MSDTEGQRGPPSPGENGQQGAGRGRTRAGEALTRQFWGEVREGVEHFHQRRGSRPPGRLRQFIHGMSLPFHLARILRTDPVAWRRYIRVGILQGLTALVLALSCMGSGKGAAENAQENREERARRREARAEARAMLEALRRAEEAKSPRQEPVSPGATTAEPRPAEAQGAPAPSEEAATPDEATDNPGTEARAAHTADGGEARSSNETASSPGQEEEGIRIQVRGKRIPELEAALRADGGTALPSVIAALVLEAIAEENALDDEDAEEAADGGTAVTTGESPSGEDTGGGATGRAPHAQAEKASPSWLMKSSRLWTLAFWAALFAAVQVAQWVVIALSRDYHTAITRDVSLLTGVPPEDEALTPRVRLNTPWLKTKLKRRWRALVLFAVGVPAVAFLTAPLHFLCLGTTVFTALTTAWGAWWWTVFTAAKSDRAWDAPPERRPPWYLRVWTWLTTRVPGLRWGVLQRYGALWTRRSEEMFAPVAQVERQPWAFAGLALVRFVGSFPPLKFFIRPLIPVASAYLLAEAGGVCASPGTPAEPSTGEAPSTPASVG